MEFRNFPNHLPTGLTAFAAGQIPYGLGSFFLGQSSNLVFDALNERLGIGTSTPSTKFHLLDGAVNCYIDGSGLAGGANFYSNTTINMGTSGNNSLVFFTNNNERVRVGSGGSIGIGGVSSPTYNISFAGSASRTIGLERHTTSNTAGNNLTLRGGGATSGATDKNGGTAILLGGIATGDGGSSYQLWSTPYLQGTGTTDRNPVLYFGSEDAENRAYFPLSIGNYINLPADGGVITLVDMDGGTALDDVEQSYVFRLGNVNMMKFYGLADGAGNIDSQKLLLYQDLEITGSKNIVLDTTTGTKFGTATTQKLSFYNATPIVQPTALSAQLTSITHTAPDTPDYAIQDLTDSGGFGFTTKDEGNTVLSVILNLQTRVAELETKLKALGLVA